MYLLSILSVLSYLPISSDASLLRNTSSRKASPLDTFDCYLYERDGIAPPGTTIEPQWTCEVEDPTDGSELRTFTFSGDIEAVMRDKFDFDITGYGGAGSRITVSWDAVVSGSSTIASDHVGITLNLDPSRRERHLAALTGDRRVLIVRVIDNAGNSPTSWQNQLYDDFFQDSNNLVSLLSLSLLLSFLKCHRFIM